MKRSQDHIIAKFKRYMDLKNSLKSSPEISGLCYGFSVCAGTMYVLGKLDWWDAAINVVLTWDGSEQSLKELVRLPNSVPNTAVTRESIIERMYHYIKFNQAGSSVEKYTLSQNTFLNPNQQFEVQDTDGNVFKIQTTNKMMGHFEYESDLIQSLDDGETKKILNSSFGYVFTRKHGCELHYNDGSWWFYDPNYEDGKHHPFATTKELVREMIRVLGTNIGIFQISFKAIDAKPFSYFNNNLCVGTLLKDDFMPTMLHRAPELTLKLLTQHLNELDQSHLSTEEIALQSANVKSTALMYAIREGHTAIAELLSQKMRDEDLSIQNADGKIAFHFASINRRLEIMRLLINRMKPEGFLLQDSNGYAAMIYAAYLEDGDIVELVLNKITPESLSMQDKKGWTALIHATNSGRLPNVKALLNRMSEDGLMLKTNLGANVICHTISNTLLNIKQKMDIVTYLIDKLPTAALSDADLEGCTPLMLALQHGLECTTFFQHPNVIANINAKNKLGMTALHYATKSNNKIMAFHIIDILNKDALNTETVEGATPFMLAAENGHLDIVTLLMNKMNDNDIHSQNKAGWTALMLAIKNGHLAVVLAIIQKLSELTFKNKEGMNAFMIAIVAKHHDIINELLKFHQDFDETINLTIDQCLPHLTRESSKLAFTYLMRYHFSKFEGSACVGPISVLHLALFTENDALVNRLLKLHVFKPEIVSDCLLIADAMRHCSQRFKNCYESLLENINEETFNKISEEYTADFNAPKDDEEAPNREFAPLPTGQKWLVDRMNAAEVSWHLDDINFGAASLHMNAMLAGYSEVERFDYRLVMISKLPLFSAYNFTHSKMRAEAQHALPVSLSNGSQYVSSDNQAIFLEIPAAFQVMYVYNNSLKFVKMLPESAVSYTANFYRPSTILQPSQVSDLGGAMPVHKLTAVFTQEELTDILIAIEQTAKKLGIPYLISCLLRSRDSSFTLGFDPKHRTWMLFDVKQAPTKYYPVSVNSNCDESQPQKPTNMHRDLVVQIFKSAKSADAEKIVITFQIICVAKHATDFYKFRDLFIHHPSYIKLTKTNFNMINFYLNDSYLNTLYLLIAQNDDTETMEKMLLVGYSPFVKTIVSDTILHKAAMNNSIGVIKAIMHYHKKDIINKFIDSLNGEDRSPLGIALICNNMDAAKLFIHYGANVNVQYKYTNDKITPLVNAIFQNNLEMVRLMIGKGARLDELTYPGVNALCHAVTRDYTDIALELIALGSAFDKIGPMNFHALIMAVRKCNRILIEKLLSLNCALKSIEAINILRDFPEMMPQFIKRGLDINWFDDGNKTALMHACNGDDIVIIKQLLKFGADPTVIQNGSSNALTCAIDAKNTNFLGLLLDHCDREYIRKHGAALLYYALTKQDTNDGMIECLIEHGCDVNYVNSKDGITVIQRAIQTNQCSIVELMLMHGANPFQHVDKAVTAVALFPEILKNTRLRNLLEKAHVFYMLIPDNFTAQSPRREAMLALLKTILNPKLSKELALSYIKRFEVMDSAIQQQILRLQVKVFMSPPKHSYYVENINKLIAIYSKLSVFCNNYDSLLNQCEEELRSIATRDKKRITNDLSFFKDSTSETKEVSDANTFHQRAANERSP